MEERGKFQKWTSTFAVFMRLLVQQVQHSLKVHWGDARVAWQRISDEDVVKAKVLEAKELIKRGITAPKEVWKCLNCIDLFTDPGKLTMEGMQHHHERRVISPLSIQTRC